MKAVFIHVLKEMPAEHIVKIGLNFREILW